MSRRAARELSVWKVGGSLLDWPAFEQRLRALLVGVQRPKQRRVIIVGGGRYVDGVRDLDREVGLGDSAAHQLALRAMDLTAHVALVLLRSCEVEVTERFDDLRATEADPRVVIFSPRRWLCEEGGDEGLPHTWEVTSDTIAARVAHRLGARELVLLKSAPLPDGWDVEHASELGLVDRWFPIEARGLSVSYVNMRSSDPPSAVSLPWRQSPSLANASSSSEASRDKT